MLCPTLKLLYSKNIILCRSFLNIKNVGQVNPSLGGNHFCPYLWFYVLTGEWKRTDQCWWFSLFRENRWFWFLGQVLKTALVLIKTFFPHSDNCPGFQKLKENLVKRFSGSAVLKEFWIVDFQGRFSQIMVFCYIYTFFGVFVFLFLQSAFFLHEIWK